MKLWRKALLAAGAALMITGSALAQAAGYDVIIRQAMVIDGTGAAGRIADIAVQGDKIAVIAPRIDGQGLLEIEGRGLVAAPGFIDIHTHTDSTIFTAPLAQSKISQGVTTEVVNNCGSGSFPLRPDSREKGFEVYRRNGYDAAARTGEWFTLKDYAAVLERLGTGVNIVPLVPHGRLRSEVMGQENRAPSPKELEKMEELLAEALQQGAWGISTGLVYVPGCFAKTDELIALAKVVAGFDGLYASHIRGEGVKNGVAEALEIGRVSGAKVQISHLKAAGINAWGRGPLLLEQLKQARAEGVRVYADQYPYNASSTGLAQQVPQWARDGGTAKLLERLNTPELRAKIIAQADRNIEKMGGPDKIMVLIKKTSTYNAGLAGKLLSQICQEWDMTPGAAAVRLLAEERGGVSAIYFTMNEEDVRVITASTDVAVGSDGSAYSAENQTSAVIHPRSYGTFARVLQQVREKQLLTLEQAVYKMTGLPAQILGMNNRGILKDGAAADLVLFDPKTVADQADYVQPHRYAAGFLYVMVNGQWALKNGEITGSRAGRVLLKQ